MSTGILLRIDENKLCRIFTYFYNLANKIFTFIKINRDRDLFL